MQNYPRGLVKGPGTGTSDSIVARVSNGEYILPKAAVDMIGKQKLDKLKNAANALHPLPRFAMGGSLNVTSGFGGQQNDMSLTDSMNRASATLKSMQTPTAAPEPTQDQKMMDAFKTFSGMFSGGNTTTPAAAPVEQKPDFMGISQKQELPKFAGGGSVNEVERARQALLRRDKPTPPLEVQRAQAAIQQREAAVPKLQTPVGAELPNLGGKPAIPNSAAKLQYPTGEVAPNLASNKPTAPIKVESAPILTGNTSTVAKPGVPTPSVATPAMQAEIAAQKAAAAQAETGRSIASRFQAQNKGEYANATALARNLGTKGLVKSVSASVAVPFLANIGYRTAKNYFGADPNTRSVKESLKDTLVDPATVQSNAAMAGLSNTERATRSFMPGGDMQKAGLWDKTKAGAQAVAADINGFIDASNPLTPLSNEVKSWFSSEKPVENKIPIVSAVKDAISGPAQPSKEALTAVIPGKPGDVAAPKVATSNEETNPLRQARLTNGSMSEAPTSVYNDLGTSNTDLIKNAAPGQESRATIATSGSIPMPDKTVTPDQPLPSVVGSRFNPKTGKSEQVFGNTVMSQKAQAMGGTSGIPQYETNYAVRGDNGGSGTVKFSGPSQRVGGGTVSVMDQGNGGTVEGNVASLTRQADAMRSLRETMNPGITTGTGQFAPRAAEPVDPFSRPTDGNGDAAGRRSQYENLIKSANDSGLTAKQRATRLAAAEAMVAPGQEAAKLQNASAMNEADNATRDRATAAQRMNSQLDAESQAAQRSQAQRNADRQAGLQADNQKFQQEKDVAQFAYKISEDAKSRGDTAYKEVQADTERYYKDSGDSKGNGRVNPSELLVFGDQLFGSKDAKLIEDKYPGLSARIANRTPRYNDYHLLKAMRDSYNKTDGWFTSPSMEEATNRFLSGK